MWGFFNSFYGWKVSWVPGPSTCLPSLCVCMGDALEQRSYENREEVGLAFGLCFVRKLVLTFYTIEPFTFYTIDINAFPSPLSQSSVSYTLDFLACPITPRKECWCFILKKFQKQRRVGRMVWSTPICPVRLSTLVSIFVPFTFYFSQVCISLNVHTQTHLSPLPFKGKRPSYHKI